MRSKRKCDRCGDIIQPLAIKIPYKKLVLYFDAGCILLMESKGLIKNMKVI